MCSSTVSILSFSAFFTDEGSDEGSDEGEGLSLDEGQSLGLNGDFGEAEDSAAAAAAASVSSTSTTSSSSASPAAAAAAAAFGTKSLSHIMDVSSFFLFFLV